MKKITLLLVIIFTFLFTNTSWGEWTYLVNNNKGDNFYYYKDGVRKSGKYIYFWELTDYIKPTKGVLSVTTYTQLDCSIFRFMQLKFHSYNKSMGEGEKTYEFIPKDEWKYPQPKSTFEYFYNKICEEHQ